MKLLLIDALVAFLTAPVLLVTACKLGLIGGVL